METVQDSIKDLARRMHIAADNSGNNSMEAYAVELDDILFRINSGLGVVESEEITDLKEIANLVRKDAVYCIEDSINAEGDFADLKGMYNEDAKDLLEVAALIEQGKLKDAYTKARHMDTAARERVNDIAWDLMAANDQ